MRKIDSMARALECLDGLSIGDAFGQCFFQQTDDSLRIDKRELPTPPWLFTDDTMMTLSVLASLSNFGEVEQDYLAESFARNYDYERAYGPSMHRVLERIRQGEPWQHVAGSSFSGQGSWGNGAAMRAAPIGAYFADDLRVVTEQAARSAVVTHAHPEGVAGAVAIALAAASAVRAQWSDKRPSHHEFLSGVIENLAHSEVCSRLIRARDIPSRSSLQFAVSVLGNGNEMSAQDTVPFALWCCAQHLDNYEEALWLALSAGGDRDTICAMVGGIVSCYVGSDGIPESWRDCREALPILQLNFPEP